MSISIQPAVMTANNKNITELKGEGNRLNDSNFSNLAKGYLGVLGVVYYISIETHYSGSSYTGNSELLRINGSLLNKSWARLCIFVVSRSQLEPFF